MIKRLLIANRGEIALRVIRACREVAVETVAVYSDADAHAPHVAAADRASRLGPAPAADSYLAIPRVIEAARASGADAVHPGYGFLSENARFAGACEHAGLTFVGPPSTVIARMGSKIDARRLAQEAGVPVVPGETPDDQSDEGLRGAIERVGLAALIKPSSGGGGKGMHRVHRPEEIADAVQGARREAVAAFGDGTLYVERLIERPRHIEVQIFGDHHGHVVHLYERDCSVQRRHQKVIEETPSPGLTSALRHRMTDAAVRVATAAGYRNAGTVEFLVDAARGVTDETPFYFLEMNTRLQVEHPVTEMVTSIDLVHWQIRIARGEHLDIDPEQAMTPRGHAIECRVYAEDPDQGFMPSPGLIRGLRPASGPGVRDDAGVSVGYTVPVFYDSLMAKLVAWAGSRQDAIDRMTRALSEYQVLGIRTTIPFFLWLMRQPDYIAGRYDTTYLDRVLAERAGPGSGTTFSELTDDEEQLAAMATGLDAYLRASAGQGTAPSSAAGLWKSAARREALRPFECLRVVPSKVEGRQAPGRALRE